MKSTLILSDTHFGEDFFEHRFLAIKELFLSYDRVILNGDFLDDFWEYKKTIQSSWSELFDILKTKEIIYLFGNHDIDSAELRAATSDFITMYADEYRLKVADRELVIMHGHSIYPRLGGILYEEQLTIFKKFLQKSFKIMEQVLYPLILIARLFIERHKKLVKLQRPIIIKQNNQMKQYAQDNLEPHQILVCGHSHLAEDSRDKQFINTGANCYDRLEYLSIRNEKIELIRKEL
jgi:predicted phosphodiesterase